MAPTVLPLSPGTYTVEEVPPTGWTQTGPNGGSYSVTVVSNTTISGEDFFNHDGVSPTVTVTALPPTNNKTPTLTGTVTDPALSGGMGSVTVVVGGQTLTATLNGTTWTVTAQRRWLTEPTPSRPRPRTCRGIRAPLQRAY